MQQFSQKTLGLQWPQPKRPTHGPASQASRTATGRPALQIEQRLAGLGTAGLTTCQQAEQLLLPRQRAALNPHGQAKGSPITEAEQGLDAATEHPGLACQHPELQTQRKFPAGGMGSGGCAEAANPAATIMARGTTAIAAGQAEHTIKGHHLQHRLEQGIGAAKGIKINQIKTTTLEQGSGQKRRRPLIVKLQIEGPGLQRLKIALQQRGTIGIGIIDPKQGRRALISRWSAEISLQGPAQGPDAAAAHQIEKLNRFSLKAPLLPLMEHQQHGKIPGWPRIWPKEAITELQRGRSFAIVGCELIQACVDPAASHTAGQRFTAEQPFTAGQPVKATGMGLGDINSGEMSCGEMDLVDLDWGDSADWYWRELRCHWRVLGPADGRPMLLLHGFGASSGHWRHNAAALSAQGFRVYGLDLIGFGASAQPSKAVLQRLDNRLWAKQVSAFLVEVMGVSDQQPAVLIGNSLGGLTAVTIAALQPQLVAAVVAAPLPDPALMAAQTNRKPRPPRWRKKLQRWLLTLACNLLPLELLVPLIARSGLLQIALQGAYCHSIRTDRGLLHLIAQPARRPTAARSLRAMCIGMAMRPGRATAPMLLDRLFRQRQPLPLLLLWGRQDRFIPLSIGLQLQQQHPGLCLEVLEKTGHCPHDENPADFNRAVLSWLDLNLVSDRQRA